MSSVLLLERTSRPVAPSTTAVTLVERAYQLAVSGECANVAEIKVRLKAENHLQVTEHLQGKAISAALTRLCRVATGQTPRRPPVRTPPGAVW